MDGGTVHSETSAWFHSGGGFLARIEEPDFWHELIRLLLHYVEVGGWVMPPLLLSLVLLWYGLGYRWSALAGTGHEDPREMLENLRAGKGPRRPRGILQNAVSRGWTLKKSNPPHLRLHLDDAFGDYDRELNRFVPLVRIIVVTAPLLGLLGTVTGMIETFKSLERNVLFSQSGGVANGISQALLTTQLGLAVAIPGLIVQDFLGRRQRRIQVSLDRIKDLLTSAPEDGAGEERAA